MKQLQSIVLGGGCFWCLDAPFSMIRGVDSVTPGYAGGTAESPTYYQVVSGGTGHAEVVKITFDSGVVSLTQLLEVFWAIHDPTTKDRQGHDIGSPYRSIILCDTETQMRIAEESIRNNQHYWPNPIVTEVAQLQHFYPAEEEHNNYFEKHPERAYCQLVINPKLEKLQQKFAQLLKN